MNPPKYHLVLVRKMASFIGPDKVFFETLDEVISYSKDQPERIYHINFNRKVYKETGITQVLFKARSAAELWLKVYRYIEKKDKNMADTKFYDETVFQQFLVDDMEEDHIWSAVFEYTAGIIEDIGDDIWAEEMKFDE
jgi:hypothetical protein